MLNIYKHKTMSAALNHDVRIAQMIFATVYPFYISKIESKGRTLKELEQVI